MDSDWWKAITVYGYYDGPTLFTAMKKKDENDQNLANLYLFRWVDDRDPSGDDDDQPRTYKADGHDITITEDEIDRGEARYG